MLPPLPKLPALPPLPPLPVIKPPEVGRVETIEGVIQVALPTVNDALARMLLVSAGARLQSLSMLPEPGGAIHIYTNSKGEHVYRYRR